MGTGRSTTARPPTTCLPAYLPTCPPTYLPLPAVAIGGASFARGVLMAFSAADLDDAMATTMDTQQHAHRLPGMRLRGVAVARKGVAGLGSSVWALKIIEHFT